MLALLFIMTYSTQIIFRIIAATLGAYFVSVLFSLAAVPAMTFLIGSRLSDAVYSSTLWSYVVFFLVFIASFSIATVKRLYLSLLALSACFYGVFVLTLESMSKVIRS